jgi:predicted amidohydrolase
VKDTILSKEVNVISRHRKIHLPRTGELFEDPDAVNRPEKKYLKPGIPGFKNLRTPDLKL